MLNEGLGEAFEGFGHAVWTQGAAIGVVAGEGKTNLFCDFVFVLRVNEETVTPLLYQALTASDLGDDAIQPPRRASLTAAPKAS